VVDARIGEGGMGVVYRAWLFHAPTSPRASDPPVPVALKSLRIAGAQRELFRRFYVNEANALRRLSHPNIVGFRDLFDHGSFVVLAIEYVHGDTLEAVIARHVARAQLAGGRLPGMAFRRAWHYFEQLLGALAAVHALGIVHRDVKPSNVLLTHDGLVKLTDFGIARVEAGAIGATSEFAPGTGLYMSPEQVLSRPLDGRSDLYSAAIVLYEMLSGRTPFSGDKSEFLIRQDQVESRPPPIRTWLAQAPPVLDALFTRALAKDPEMRFRNAFDMGEAFRSALGIVESPAWRANMEIAKKATQHDEGRMATLRDMVAQGYKTEKIAAMG
jgi:serine/threonine-protein kinase